ncbi:TPA: hypothetical protein ACSP3S_004227, partial [Aeromonas veronii]
RIQAACQGIRRVPSGGIGECRTSKLNSRITSEIPYRSKVRQPLVAHPTPPKAAEIPNISQTNHSTTACSHRISSSTKLKTLILLHTVRQAITAIVPMSNRDAHCKAVHRHAEDVVSQQTTCHVLIAA